MVLEPHQAQFYFANVVEQERVARCERARSSDEASVRGLKCRLFTNRWLPQTTCAAGSISKLLGRSSAFCLDAHPAASSRQRYGTNTEGSEGEGLSRYLAARLLAINGLGYPPAGFDNSNLWMNSPRNDFVNNINKTDDGPDAITGCALLFIYYLFSQLGHTENQIVAAGAPTLAGVYNNLTGDAGDRFPYFKALVGSGYPGTSTIPGPNLDNPFPLARPLQVWTWDGWGWGTFDIAFSFGRSVLNRHSHIEVSICELGGQPLDYPFIGAATMTVLNVAPTDDGVVNVRFEIQWSSVLQWRATFFIE